VSPLGLDLLVATLCPLHAAIYNACVEGGETGIKRVAKECGES
jgi:hypothetical protein